jgi:hypothetical protein
MNIAVPTSAFTTSSAIVAAMAATSCLSTATSSTAVIAGEIFRCRTYDELVRGLIERRRALGLTQAELDYRSSLPSGYVGKLEGPARPKRFGMLSLSMVLAALDIELIAVPRASSKNLPKRA